MAELTVYDVIVIGYGAAGMAATKKLHEAGLKVLVLEASNRMGGRIHSIPFTDTVVDLGAEFVDGQKGNIIYETYVGIDQFGSLPRRNFVLTDGTTLDRDITHKLNALWKNILADLKKKDYIDGQVTVGEYFVQEFETRVKGEEYSDVPDQVKSDFLNYIHKTECGRCASDSWFLPSAMSYINGWEECPGIQGITWKYGFRTMLERIVLEIEEIYHQNPSFPKGEVEYEKEVTQVDYEEADGTEDHPVAVRCTDGSLYKAKTVLVTVSLGVLKAGEHTMFNPILPMENRKAIVGLGYENVGKVVMYFKKEWWFNTNCEDGAKILWTEEDRDNLKEEEEWLLGARAFYKPEHHRFVLTLWVTGRESKTMETLPMETLKEHVMKLLKMVHGRDKDIPQISKIERTNWNSNPLFRGAYSYRSVYSEGMGTNAEDLATPILHETAPVVCFAGEATSAHHYGTAHGALETGIREGERLVEYFKKNTEITSNETVS